MKNNLLNKLWLITGGSGSFGQAATKYILDKLEPVAIRIYSRGEMLQSEMREKFQDERLRFIIGDVRERSRLTRAFTDVEIVLHAAALKQIPTVEYSPVEAVSTNINGAINVIEAALDMDVERVFAISTDKAVYPVNMYGATKLVAEKLLVQGNAYAGKRRMRFACVRYGNVLGSRGSVVPVFLEQKKTGRLTITDERMTRFWLTLEQGVEFVMRCLNEMKGGEVFIPKIPSMSVMDVANAIAPEVEKKIIGIRAGEKLHEVLLTEEESTHSLEFDDHYVIVPEMMFWDDVEYKGKPAPIRRYSSDTNTDWLTKEKLLEMIEGI